MYLVFRSASVYAVNFRALCALLMASDVMSRPSGVAEQWMIISSMKRVVWIMVVEFMGL